MERIPPLISLLLLFMATEILTTSVERENKSSSAGLIWSTAKEEGDLEHKSGHADDSTAAADDVDGGFSSLEGMLQWAIGLVIFLHISSILTIRGKIRYSNRIL